MTSFKNIIVLLVALIALSDILSVVDARVHSGDGSGKAPATTKKGKGGGEKKGKGGSTKKGKGGGEKKGKGGSEKKGKGGGEKKGKGGEKKGKGGGPAPTPIKSSEKK
jgi:hypothetical protein